MPNIRVHNRVCAARDTSVVTQILNLVFVSGVAAAAGVLVVPYVVRRYAGIRKFLSSIPVAGMVLTHAVGNSGNAEAIRDFSNVEVLLELYHKEDKRLLVAEVERSGIIDRLLSA